MKRLAIIPARGGSKRIPEKNKKLFLGTPIISLVLKEVIDSNLFDEIHISTDDNDIYNLASNAGHKPKFPRPEKLCSDTSKISEVLLFVYNEYKNLGHKFDTFALIYPTAVLINSDFIIQAVKNFETEKKFDQLISVAEYPVSIEKALSLAEDFQVKPIFKDKIEKNSQDLKKNYYETGDFVIYSEFGLLNNSVSSRKRGFLIPREKSVDIDYPDDWDFAEKLFKLNLL